MGCIWMLLIEDVLLVVFLVGVFGIFPEQETIVIANNYWIPLCRIPLQ